MVGWAFRIRMGCFLCHVYGSGSLFSRMDAYGESDVRKDAEERES